MIIKKFGVSKFIIIINVLIYVSYLILINLLLPYRIEFRSNVVGFIAINKFIFLVISTILFIKLIWSEKYIGDLSKLIFSLLSAIIALIITVILIILPYLFNVKGEVFAYREGNLILVGSGLGGLHDTTVRFYNPINSILMQESDIEDFSYSGISNCYIYEYDDFLQSSEFDIRKDHEFKKLNPLSAKKKFSYGIFKYLGDETYDFGDVIIKFNSQEIEIENAVIERNIVKYGDCNIIGENIEDIKANIEKINITSNKETRYEEFLDEQGNKNVRIGVNDKYGEFYYNSILVVNNSGIVTRVKYLNNESSLN